VSIRTWDPTAKVELRVPPAVEIRQQWRFGSKGAVQLQIEADRLGPADWDAVSELIGHVQEFVNGLPAAASVSEDGTQ